MRGAPFATLWTFLTTIFARQFGVDYCDESMKCGQLQHLLCKFKHQSSKNGDCTNIRGRMTPEERMWIMKYHNDYRNELAMDVEAVTNPPPEFEKFKRQPPDNWLTGLYGARCMRQFSWAYDNEKAAQIWAEQCVGDDEIYQCMKDFNEGFPQNMNVFTINGTIDGESLMHKAINHWISTSELIEGERMEGGSGRYDTNKFDDFKFSVTETKFLPWAHLAFWRTFLIGCGKAHYQIGGQDKTKFVCVYGPGIDYIAELREKGIKNGGMLYEKPGYLTKPCRRGNDGDPEQFEYEHWGFNISYPSCPNFLCACSGRRPYEEGPMQYGRWEWPFLCTSDCQLRSPRPELIPGVMEFMGAEASNVHPSIFILGMAITSSCSLFVWT